MNKAKINIIGAGLAGSEAANFLANKGYEVHLYEKRPVAKSPAHHTDLFGELVCSNSLKNKKLDNACGLLKEEIRRLGSLMMEASDKSAVPGGDSLAVDRTVFAEYITSKIKNNPNIIIHYEDVKELKDGYTIIATGPLSDENILNLIGEISGEKSYGFYDASAPIIEKSSIDFSKVFMKSHYKKGDDS
jgi:methylenetetrahydrofolate--tRNA-(uracil-5-)-methyltransferase